MQPVPELAFLELMDWVLVGDLALRDYMPERATQDVEIMIHAQDESVAQAAFV